MILRSNQHTWKIPLTLHQQFLKESLSLWGVWPQKKNPAPFKKLNPLQGDERWMVVHTLYNRCDQYELCVDSCAAW